MKWNLPICSLQSKDKWIQVRICKQNLQRLHLQTERVSARLTTDKHLFISGTILKSDISNVFADHLINIACNIEDVEGNILIPVRDTHSKNIELNPCESFFLAIYRIDRFLDPNEIDHIVLYCDCTEKTQKNQ